MPAGRPVLLGASGVGLDDESPLRSPLVGELRESLGAEFGSAVEEGRALDDALAAASASLRAM